MANFTDPQSAFGFFALPWLQNPITVNLCGICVL